MGKSFDSLVEIVNKGLIKNKHKSQHAYLETLLQKTTLFDLPYNPSEDLLDHEKNIETCKKQFIDYFDFSAKYNRHLIMPFEITAIENFNSVVIFENLNESTFAVTRYKQTFPDRTMNLSIVKTELGNVDFDGGMDLKMGFFYLPGYVSDKQKMNYAKIVSDDISTFMNELVFLLDPENFIIKKQTKESAKNEALIKNNRKKEKKIKKTVMRPHYVCMAIDDATDFLKGKSNQPRLIHPVRGHKRVLVSDFYKNKQGEIIYIPQHFRGQGLIEDTQGWKYEVVLKKSPIELVEYSKL